MSRACAGALGVAFAVSGCAIHPLPEDVSGVPTYVIVRQIRCEARQAIIENAIGWLGSAALTACPARVFAAGAPQ